MVSSTGKSTRHSAHIYLGLGSSRGIITLCASDCSSSLRLIPAQAGLLRETDSGGAGMLDAVVSSRSEEVRGLMNNMEEIQKSPDLNQASGY